jgi:TolA-binding protein
MQSEVWPQVAGAIGFFVLLTTVITVTVWQLAATSRAKVLAGREDAYRELATSAVTAQDGANRQIAELREQLAAMDAKLQSIEHVLKDVE